ncbi:MAG: hypothetical protein WB762_19810 [Candidatus Sulfotelmatobacter sp.]
MKRIFKTRSFGCTALALGALFAMTRTDASADDFYPSYLPAKVIAHLPLSGGARQMFLQQEGRKRYLYVQQSSQQVVTVVDVTKPERPKVLNHMPHGNLTMVGSGLAISETPENSAPVRTSVVAGNAEGPRGGGTVPESVRVLDVSDPAHPRTVQTFDGVTSILQDPARNLIYVANGDGVWIVSHQQVLRRHECSSSDEMSPMPNCD